MFALGGCFSGERLATPERAVSEPLHLLRESALEGCWLAIQRSGEHAYAAGIDAVKSREAHGGSDSTRRPAPDDLGTTLGEDLDHRRRNAHLRNARSPTLPAPTRLIP
jgi:hypothetical protein